MGCDFLFFLYWKALCNIHKSYFYYSTPFPELPHVCPCFTARTDYYVCRFCHGLFLIFFRFLCHSSRLHRCRPKFPRLPQTTGQKNLPEELSPMFQTSSFTPFYYAEIRLSMPTQSAKPVASPKNNAIPLLIEIILRFLYIDYYNCVITASKVHFLLPNFLPCPFADFLRVFAVFFGEGIAV